MMLRKGIWEYNNRPSGMCNRRSGYVTGSRLSYLVTGMTDKRFWLIIDRACKSDSRMSDEWNDNLVSELQQLSPDEIIEWNHIFDRLVAQACTIDLMAACYIMNTGAGDDGFYY